MGHPDVCDSGNSEGNRQHRHDFVSLPYIYIYIYAFRMGSFPSVLRHPHVFPLSLSSLAGKFCGEWDSEEVKLTTGLYEGGKGVAGRRDIYLCIGHQDILTQKPPPLGRFWEKYIAKRREEERG